METSLDEFVRGRLHFQLLLTGMGPAFLLVCEDGTHFKEKGLGRELNHALEAIWINTGSYYSFDVGAATEETLMRISSSAPKTLSCHNYIRM